MRPSVYDEVTAKDTVVEHRDQVKVTFKGGNVFHIEADGADAHEVRRGGKATWERAEKLRLELDPAYAGPPPANPPETTTNAPAASPGADDDAGKAPAANGGTGGEKPKESTDGDKPKADDEGEKQPVAEEPEQPRVYRVGDVVGELRLVPVDVVMDLLGGDAGRVSMLQGSDEARRLSRRVRATDGRCAPIFFTRVDVDDRHEAPALFDGLYTLACAINLGLKRVAVVILPSGKVGSIQGNISALMRASLSAEADDDEMMYRANSD